MSYRLTAAPAMQAPTKDLKNIFKFGSTFLFLLFFIVHTSEFSAFITLSLILIARKNFDFALYQI